MDVIQTDKIVITGAGGNFTADIDWAGKAASLVRLLEEHKAESPAALDLRPFSIWTDFFVVASAGSAAHIDGLLRHVEEWAAAEGIPVRRPPRKNRAASLTESNIIWEIIDLGNIVVHLFSKEGRAFYELERLWEAG